MKPTTKAELMEELNFIKARLRAKEEELENLKRYEKYVELGNELKAMHNALIDSGFTDEQAFRLLQTMIPQAVAMANTDKKEKEQRNEPHLFQTA